MYREVFGPLIALAAVGAPAHAPPASQTLDDASETQTPSPGSGCVEHWQEVRYRAYGYDHIVHLRNTCARTAHCSVTTDVNPQPTSAVLPARTETEVTTWIGSPASVFFASVQCDL